MNLSFQKKEKRKKKHCRKMNKKKMLQFRLVKNTLPFVFISFIIRMARKNHSPLSACFLALHSILKTCRKHQDFD